MAKSYKQPASLEVTQYLDAPGRYLFLVNDIDEEPTKHNGEVQDAIKLDMTVEGGECDKGVSSIDIQMKRSFSPLLFNPKESHRDGGEFAAKVHLRLADACGILPKAAPGEEIEIDWSKARGRVIVAFVKWSREKEGQDRRLEIDGAHIYHVDDNEVAHVPKNNKVLGLLPPALRRIQKGAAGATNKAPATGAKTNGAGTAANKTAAANGNGNGNSSAAATAAAETFNADDL